MADVDLYVSDQCGAVYQSGERRGCFAMVFCLRPAGHEGDHRGQGRQWDDGGKKEITIVMRDGRPVEDLRTET